MAWFRRNKAPQNTIPELQEYYNAERRERSGLSWLLALVSVACAGLLVIGLVFGGKWLYRKLARNMDKNKTTTAQTQNKPNSQPVTPVETDTTQPTETANNAAQTPAANPNPAATTPAPTAAQTPAASGSTTPPVPAPATTPVTTPTTSGAIASASSPLPHTGPVGTVAIFITTAFLATAVRYTLFKRKFLN